MGTWYSNKYVSVGDVLYFSKFGTTITSGYSSASGTFGTCYGTVTSLYASSYAFPVVISGKVTAGTGGSFTACTVKPADCIKGYQCYVTYSHNGGSGTASQTGYVGASLTGSSSRTGYQFAGWYTAASGGSKVTTIPTSVNGATYYAHWTGNTYYVKFNGNGNTGGSTAQETFTYGTAKALTANGFTRTGYTFKNWNKNSSGTSTSYSNKQSVSNLTTTNKGTVNLYAQWTPNTYYVSFNGNGSTSGSMKKETFTYGTSQALTSNAFSKGTAYSFNGWNTKADGSGTSYTNGQSVKNLTSTSGGTVTLYAQWKLRYIYPTIGNITALRYENNQEDDVGTCVHVEFPWSVDTVVPTEAGITNYASKIALKYRVNGDTQWTLLDEVNYTASTGSSSDTYSYTSPTGTVDIELTYDILVELTDYYGTSISISAPQATNTSFISKAFFTMDFATGGHGVGIGIPAPEEGLDIGLQTTFYNNTTVRMRKQYDNETGAWFSVSMLDLPNNDGDSYIQLGWGTNSDNRGIYLGQRGTVPAHWMIREYWANGTPRIEIGNSAYTNGVWLMGHNSSIGTYTTGSGEASLSNSTSMIAQWKKITTLAAGSWVIMCSARFQPNAASGTHAFSINCGNTTHGSAYTAGVNGTTSTISECFSTLVSNTASLDVYINARQNSGAAVTVSYYWRVMRVA